MAATNTTRFSDQQYRNWLKDTLSQLYLKEALEHIVDADADQFHQSLQKALGVFGAAPMTCFNCTQNDMRKDFRQQKWSITCGLCDQWLQQIVQNHANQPLPNLHRENTDPQLWPTNPYEVFKCYMPYGCQQDQSAKDADSQSILNVLKNCVYFSKCGRIGRLDLVDELLEIRNSLFHSGNFLVANPKLQADMQTMLAFLRGLTALSGVEQNAVDEAIDKIQQLQANKVDLSLNRELELQALQQQQIALEKDLESHKTKLTTVKSDMKSLEKTVTSATAKGAATDLAVKAIQTDLGTHSTNLTAVKSDMKILEKTVTSATTKGAATDLAVKAIQTDLGTHSTKLTAVKSDMKSLEKTVTSATTKGAATDLAMKAIQTDLGTHNTNLTAVKSDMKILEKTVTSATAKGAATDLAMKAIQTDLGTHSTNLTAVKSDMKILEKTVTSATAKGAATDLAVKAIQTDLGTHSTKLTAVKSDMKILEKTVTSATAKGAATDLAVKAIQTDLGTHNTKLTAVCSEVKSLQKDVRSATATELDVKTLAEKTKGLELRMQKLQVVRDKFARFLQANDLEQDVGKLSHTMEQHGQRIQTLEEQTQTQSSELQAQRSELESCKRTLCDHEEELKSIQLKTGSETGQMTEADIADLQAALIKHYRDYHLMVPNPVVPAELGLDEIYVPPDIKVLRETKNPRTGLVNVQDRATPANTSVCKQLFYTEDYRSKSVYVTSDAGMGKTMFSKHLVNLWCRAQSDKLAGTSTGGDSAASSQHTEPSDAPPAASSQRTDPSDPASAASSQHTEPYDCPVIEFEESDSDDSQSDFDSSDSDDSQSDFDDRNVDLTEDDVSTMSNFRLLFYITLRNSSNKYDIVDMIDAQILRNIKFKKTLKAFDLLQNEGCLVIIDGLDEWVCPEGVDVPHFVNPGIPGRMSLNSNTVYLTTTRPWKFDVLKLKGFDVDKHVELKGLNEKSSKQLCSKVIRLLSDCENVTKSRYVWAELEKKGLSHLHNVPVILTLLTCLFFDKQELGNSQVQLYCSMIEMLLKRPDKGLPKPKFTVAQNADHSEKLLPECFSKYRSCQVHQHLLVTLAKIAFEALFNEERENSLVFESSQMTIFGVDQKDIDLCLKAGILSQNKVLGKWSVCEKRMSFLHKKLQEFLAAIFITNSEGGENVLSRVKSYCSTVEKVLEMSQTCMFVSGLNTEVSCRLLTYLMDHVVCNDPAVQQYRQNTDEPYKTCIHSIQTCIVDCTVEALNNQHTDSLPLHDFFITQQTISECLKRLLTSNISAVKSVYINTVYMFTDDMTSDNVEFVDHTLHQLQDKQCLQKLYLSDPDNVISDKTLSKTITNNSNLSSLVLHDISLGTEISAAVCGALNHLTALKLDEVTLPHKEIQLLMSSLSQAAALIQLKLVELDCTHHGGYCWPDIDISQLNTSCLQDLTLWEVSIQESHLREFVRQLSSVSHKVTVVLTLVTVTADSENPVDLSYLTHDRCLVVTELEHNWNNTWYIQFHTRQQTTT